MAVAAPTPKAKKEVKKPKAENTQQRRKRIVSEESSRKSKRGVVHPKPNVYLFGVDNAPMTDEDAKMLIGYEEEPEGITWTEEEIMGTNINGKKFRCINNPTNRPFRMTLAKRYMSEMVRGKWRLNGETIVLDKYDFVQSGQHRLIGLILAEQLRLQNPDKWKQDYGVDGPITLEVIVVRGISSERDTADTIDIGQKRSLGDVLYRDQRFTGEDVTKKRLKTLSDTLAHAVRLVWIRAGGKEVSDAKHFPHSEALDFLEIHPKIKDAVEYIALESKKQERKTISNGYAAGLLYLMATSGTDIDVYREEGPEALDLSMWDKACEFWSRFYSSNLKEGDPILACREVVSDIDAQWGFSRDEIVGTVVKAFNMWVDKEKDVSAEQLKLQRGRDDNANVRLLEEPRLGGLDTKVEKVKPEPAEDETPAAKPKAKKVMTVKKTEKGSKKGKSWAVGDKAWVKQAEDDIWFGEIIEVADDKKSGVLKQLETNEEWEVNFRHLKLEYPG